MKPLRRLLKVLSLLIATAAAQEELHCIVIDVPLNNLMLVREEMALASRPVAGEEPQLFSTNGHPRKVIFHGSVALSGMQGVELGTGKREDMSSKSGGAEPGVTIAVEVLPDGMATLHRYDFSMLLPWGSGDYQRFQTHGQTLPVKADSWQEVASWTSRSRSVMLWQFVARKSSKPADRDWERERRPDTERHYSVEVLFSIVPQATADQLHTISPELASLAVDLQYLDEGGQWKYFRINGRSGIPFNSSASRIDPKRLQEPGYEEANLATLDGTLIVRDTGIITVTGQLKAPGELPGETEIKTCPFQADVPLGEWRFQTISDGPAIKWNQPTLPGWTPGHPFGNGKVNFVAFRVLKVGE